MGVGRWVDLHRPRTHDGSRLLDGVKTQMRDGVGPPKCEKRL